jgi:hypothetical protein
MMEMTMVADGYASFRLVASTEITPCATGLSPVQVSTQHSWKYLLMHMPLPRTAIRSASRMSLLATDLQHQSLEPPYDPHDRQPLRD